MVLVVVEVLDSSVRREVMVQVHSHRSTVVVGGTMVVMMVVGGTMVVVGNALFSLLHHRFFGRDECESGGREGIPWGFPVILIYVREG
ncbi:hypothetical protein SADUNF_Sadunf19G0037700 [Salix dunnii]|uniref:Uncharacterized protein n=1 Tax=Salix dunnii TaxID=1413687 RepID=A0A835J350_9ROSI|nr:hypothetical protein SADUNF_Sadunf19G0037700 [Salix dunnii]